MVIIHSSFHHGFIKGKKFEVRFVLRRCTLRMQHRAVIMADELINKKKFHFFDVSHTEDDKKPLGNDQETSLQ